MGASLERPPLLCTLQRPAQGPEGEPHTQGPLSIPSTVGIGQCQPFPEVAGSHSQQSHEKGLDLRWEDEWCWSPVWLSNPTVTNTAADRHPSDPDHTATLTAHSSCSAAHLLSHIHTQSRRQWSQSSRRQPAGPTLTHRPLSGLGWLGQEQGGLPREVAQGLQTSDGVGAPILGLSP